MSKKLVKLVMEKVKELFENSEHQGEVLIGLYKMAFPDWEKIKKIDGWPAVNPETHKEISCLFIEFDKKHHPEVLPGGLWLNNGFSSSDCVPPGYVDVSPCKVVYKVE